MEFALLAATVFYGIVVGFFFGLTGSGGTTLAVPLLVYGLGLRPHRAICAAMVAVGTMATIEAIQRLRTGKVHLRAGAMVAAAGFFSAPLGAWIGTMLDEKWLLLLFAVVVVLVAARMYSQASAGSSAAGSAQPDTAPVGEAELHRDGRTSALRREASARVVQLAAAGLVTGVLAGMLGVGGGFLIVPALVLFGRLEMHRAVATSMPVVAVVSVAAMGAHLLSGQRVPLATTAAFAAGGLIGLAPGSWFCERLSGQRLQQLFAAALTQSSVSSRRGTNGSTCVTRCPFNSQRQTRGPVARSNPFNSSGATRLGSSTSRTPCSWQLKTFA